MRKKSISLKKNFIYSTLFQIFTMITPFITAPYVSRVLGAEGVGIQSYVGSIQSYFLLFAALGTSAYGNREISQARDDKELYSKKFFEIEAITIITSSVCLIIWIILALVNKKYRIYYFAMIPYVFGTMFDISWFYNGLENFKTTVLCNVLFKILGIISIFTLVKSCRDLVLYILIMASTTMLANLAMWIYLPQYLGKIDLKTLRFKHHIKQTFMYFVPTIASSIYTVLDKTLIGLITQDDFQNGYYEQATKIINMAKSVSFVAVNAVMGTRISYLFSQKKEQEIKNKIDNSMNFIMFMSIGSCFGIMGIARNFVPVFFGSGYEAVVTLLYIFSPIIVIIGVSNCLGSQYYTPSGRRNDSTKYLIIGSIINLFLNLIMIKKYGAIGAAIASVMAELSISILYVKNSKGFMTMKILVKSSVKKIMAGVIMLVIIVLLEKSIVVHPIFEITLQIVVGIVSYIFILLITKDEWALNMSSKIISRKFIDRN